MQKQSTQPTQQAKPQGAPLYTCNVGSTPAALYHLFGRRYGVWQGNAFAGYMLARSPVHAINRMAVAGQWAEFAATLATVNTYALRMAARKAARQAAKAAPAKASKGKGKAAKAAPQPAPVGNVGKGRKAAARKAKAPSLAALLAA